MAGGINHAKQIVIDEATDLVKKLNEEGLDDPKVNVQATSLILRMITPMFAAEFVTVDDCKQKHKSMRDPDKKLVKLRLGPFAVEGNFSPLIFMMLFMMVGIGCLIYALGKSETWW